MSTTVAGFWPEDTFLGNLLTKTSIHVGFISLHGLLFQVIFKSSSSGFQVVLQVNLLQRLPIKSFSSGLQVNVQVWGCGGGEEGWWWWKVNLYIVLVRRKGGGGGRSTYMLYWLGGG